MSSYYQRRGRARYLERRAKDPAWYAECKAQTAERLATWPGRITQLVAAARCRARKRGTPFALTTDHIEHTLECQAYRCAVTGIELTLANESNAHHNPWAPSIDQIEPGAGYTADNIRVVCWIYNAAKGQFTDSEVLHFAEQLTKRHPQ